MGWIREFGREYNVPDRISDNARDNHPRAAASGQHEPRRQRGQCGSETTRQKGVEVNHIFKNREEVTK